MVMTMKMDNADGGIKKKGPVVGSPGPFHTLLS